MTIRSQLRLALGLAVLIGMPRLVVAQQSYGPAPVSSIPQRLAELEAEVASLRAASQVARAVPAESSLNMPVSHALSACENGCRCPQPASASSGACANCGGSRSGAGGKSKYPAMSLTGFFQADAAWFVQSENNRLTVGDIQDGADFRRARLAAKGDLASNVDCMIEFDFAFPGRPTFMDVYTTVKNLPWLSNFRVGQWRQPFGLDAQTSVKELTFLERALPFAFVPFRQIGAGAFDEMEDERGTWAVSLFRYPTDVFGGNVGDDGGYSMTGRLTRLIVDQESDGALLHVGGGYSYVNPANNSLRLLTPPELFIQEVPGTLRPPDGREFVPPFVDTGFIDTDHQHLFNLELAGVSGAFHGQAEYYYTRIDQTDGPGLAFHGGYAQLGYVLTGEQRAYNRAAGALARVVPYQNFAPGCGWGAWETAFRWSIIDLNSQNIQGGQLSDLTYGLNWYLNRFTKFQFNYIHPFLDNPTYGKSNADIFAVRCQADF
ncbi:MAG: porin [Pirellulaceae bacterium]|nr:porin [Pirellulaceae bacterium]